MTPGAIDGAREGWRATVDRVYRVNVRFGRFQSGELVTIPDEDLPEYQGPIDKAYLEEVRTPQGQLADYDYDFGGADAVAFGAFRSGGGLVETALGDPGTVTTNAEPAETEPTE